MMITNILTIILQITVVCRLISHRIPSFGFVVKETDKGGPILQDECRNALLSTEHYVDVKVTTSE